MSRVCTPLCSPERETGMLEIGFSDMMCDVGNAAIKDAIANIARNRKVLHFLSCIARFLGYFSGLATSGQREFTSTSRAFYVKLTPNSPTSDWSVTQDTRPLSSVHTGACGFCCARGYVPFTGEVESTYLMSSTSLPISL